MKEGSDAVLILCAFLWSMVELDTHRIWYPTWKMTRVQAAQDQVRPPPPVRALCAQRRALQVRMAHHRTSVCLSCFLASLLFAFCVLRFAFSGSLIPPSYTLLRTSCFVLRASVLLPFYFLRNLPTYNKQTNQTKLTSPSSPLPFPPYTNLTETNTSRAPSGTTSREDTARSRSASAGWSASSTRCTPSSLRMRMRRRVCSRLCRCRGWGWERGWVWGRG